MRLLIDRQTVEMELNTGSAKSMNSEETYNNCFKGKVQLRQTDTVFKSYTGEKIRPKGIMTVRVEYNGTSADLELFVAAKGGTSLFGGDWLQSIRLKWPDMKSARHVK